MPVRTAFIGQYKFLDKGKVTIISNSKNSERRIAYIKGFTLIEILLVMLITAILILGINVVHRQVFLLWSNYEISQPIYHDARLITETLRQELSSLYFPPQAEGQENNCFDLLSSADGKTDLIFYTLTPCWRSSLQSSRIAKVHYRFTFDQDTAKGQIERLEQPVAGEKLVGTETSDIIIKGLSDFKISVLDPNFDFIGEDWMQSYNSRDIPPKAVKILLKWPANKNVGEIDFQTSFLVPCQSLCIREEP